MDLSFWNQSFVEKLVQSVCLMLMHSIWQGLIIAVLAGVVLWFTKKSKPALRYNLLAGLLLAFILMAGGTFWLQITEDSRASLSNAYEFVSHKKTTIYLNNSPGESFGASLKEFWIKPAIRFCTGHSSLIVTIWLFVFTLKSVSAASGLFYLKKIRTQRVTEPDEQWEAHLRRLCGKMRIAQPVQLLESALVKVPMVAGYLKPVILLPIGMLCNLSTEQIEAILLHELAHIKRRDYLINLVQIVCENIFFFNPALLWLSGLIREEREHCCDDLAISVMQDSHSLVHALVTFQEYSLKGPTAGLAFSRKRNHLLDRIKRIIYQNNKQLNAMEKLFVTLSLVAVTAFSAAMTKSDPQRQPATDRQINASVAIQNPANQHADYHPDTLPKKKTGAISDNTIYSANVYSASEGVSTYHVTSGGKEYQIVKKAGKIISLDIDGKEIPADQYDLYEKEVDQIEQEIKVAHERAEVERRNADEMRAKADTERANAENLRDAAEQSRLHADDSRKAAEKIREQAEHLRHQAIKLREEAEKMHIAAGHNREEAEKAREKAEVARQNAEKDRKEFEKKQNALIKDLSDAGLVKDKGSLSYKLSQEELIVNGVKQPDDFHKKMKAKYIQDQAVEMVYNFKGRTGYTVSGMIYSR
ncbi:M56 family metallopeptidase [Dyadobacter aurulentus]|uniref:M56 family metallopeptidase n=1 Tax=Dyadobacter sp. UC 10 TaxID=2605428 RepID=UPI0011F3B6F9|nr:M56 family metallopeptidase [Dyadobacter sp. UC 10]KAA0993676.1 M48 family metalloprotease [Dyadobacter sp. UC 10]